jgi:RimJ/RimL family protein N-acetyltransferase
MSILLETERLLFRPHQESDLDAYAEMMADPEFRRLSGGKALTRAEAAESLRSILTGQQPLLQSPPGPMGLFATVLKSENRYIGRCGIYPNRNDDGTIVFSREANLGYYIARPYWNQGLATEAGRALIRHAFETLNLTRLTAGTSNNNPASNRVLVNLGFTLVESGGDGKQSWHLYELRKP